MNEINFLVFQKVTLKATILGIRMCSTELRPWKNRKGSTRYPMILYKRDSTADIFLLMFSFFFGQAISQNSSKPLIIKACYLFIMSI